MTADLSPAPSRSQHLKASTTATHDALDTRIMSGDIFASRARFAKFLRVQYRFHRAIAPLYAAPSLAALIPDLDARPRLAQIADDLGDLGETLPAAATAVLPDAPSLPVALGWLYVAEGSNLGGAVLYKLAARLGLDAGFGARHLAAHPDGAARHWRRFTAALDAVVLTPEQDAEAVDGANAAFRLVRGYVEEEFA